MKRRRYFGQEEIKKREEESERNLVDGEVEESWEEGVKMERAQGKCLQLSPESMEGGNASSNVSPSDKGIKKGPNAGKKTKAGGSEMEMKMAKFNDIDLEIDSEYESAHRDISNKLKNGEIIKISTKAYGNNQLFNMNSLGREMDINSSGDKQDPSELADHISFGGKQLQIQNTIQIQNSQILQNYNSVTSKNKANFSNQQAKIDEEDLSILSEEVVQSLKKTITPDKEDVQDVREEQDQIDELDKTRITNQIDQPLDQIEPENQMKNDYLEELREFNNMTVTSLMDHINKTHPKNMRQDLIVQQNWPIFQGIGSLLQTQCCSSTKITKLAKSIGLGHSLYLMTLKSYIKLFFLMAIISTPLCVILASGDRVDGLNLGHGLGEFFGKLTLGNIGDLGDVTCDSSNIASLDTNLTLQCARGTLTKLVSVGMTKVDNQQICQPEKILSTTIQTDEKGQIVSADPTNFNLPQLTTIHNFVDFESKCSSYLGKGLRESGFATMLKEQFGLKCRGKKQCTVDYDWKKINPECMDQVLKRSMASKYDTLYSTFSPQEVKTQDYNAFRAIHSFDASIPEPVIYLIGYCDNQELKVKGFDVYLNKQQLAGWIVATDIIIIVVFIIGVNLIQASQRDFVNSYKEQTVEMRDFTLVIDDLPESFKQYGDETSLRFGIWRKIQDKIQACIDEGLCPPNVNCNIVDISIARSDQQRLSDQREIVRALDVVGQKQGKYLDVMFMQDLITQNMTPRRKFLRTREMEKARDGVKEAVDVLKVKVEEFKQKHSEGAEKRLQVKERLKDFHSNIVKVYVTFECMKTKNLVERLFWTTTYNKLLRIPQICARSKPKINLAQQEQNEEIQSERQWGQLVVVDEENSQADFFVEEFEDKVDQDLKVSTPQADPEFIKWHNLTKSPVQRILGGFVVFIGFCIIVGFTVVMLEIFYERLRRDGQIQQSFNCGSELIKIEDVVRNAKTSANNKKEGVAQCFCKQQFSADPMGILNFDFNRTLTTMRKNKEYPPLEPLTVEQPLPNFCRIWFEEYTYFQTMAYGPAAVVVAILNVLGYPFAIISAKVMMHQERTYQIQTKMLVTVILQALVICLVLILYLEKRPEVVSFQPMWFIAVGQTIEFALLILFALYYCGVILRYLWVNFARFNDRGFNCTYYKYDNPKKWENENDHLKAAKNDQKQQELSDRVRTMKESRSALNDLYTGDEFEAGFSQAQIILTIFICLIYSGGMPFLYPLSFGTLFCIYWFNKFSILKFSPKNKSFSEDFIDTAYKLLKYPIFVHLLMSIYMFLQTPSILGFDLVTEDFDNSSRKGLQNLTKISMKDVQAMPVFAKIYIAFIIVVLCLYVFNLFIFNPVSCFFKEGCFYVKKDTSLGIKSRNLRAQKTIEKIKGGSTLDPTMSYGQYFDQINRNLQDANLRLDIENSQSSQSDLNPQRYSAARRQEVIEYQMDLQNWRNSLSGKNDKQFDTKTFKVSSTNFFQEIKFEYLRFYYESTIQQLVASIQRLNLLKRISNINQGSQFGKVFQKKYDQFCFYHSQLLANKIKIEREIDYHVDFIENQVDVYAHKENRNLEVSDISVVLNNMVHISAPQTNGASIVANNITKLEVIQKIYQESDEDKNEQENQLGERSPTVATEDQRIQKIDQITNQEINEVVNNIQRMNSRINQIEDQRAEREMKASSMPYMRKLKYLQTNFSEEWLRKNFAPKRFRCQSISQSYSVYGNLNRYFGSGLAVNTPLFNQSLKGMLERAQMIIDDPFLENLISGHIYRQKGY